MAGTQTEPRRGPDSRGAGAVDRGKPAGQQVGNRQSAGWADSRADSRADGRAGSRANGSTPARTGAERHNDGRAERWPVVTAADTVASESAVDCPPAAQPGGA